MEQIDLGEMREWKKKEGNNDEDWENEEEDLVIIEGIRKLRSQREKLLIRIEAIKKEVKRSVEMYKITKKFQERDGRYEEDDMEEDQEEGGDQKG